MADNRQTSGTVRLSKLPVPSKRYTKAPEQTQTRPVGETARQLSTGLYVPKQRSTSKLPGPTRLGVDRPPNPLVTLPAIGNGDATAEKQRPGGSVEQGPEKPAEASNGLLSTDEPRPRSGWIDPDEALPSVEDYAPVDGGAAPAITTPRSKPRASLAERTIETISRIPPSPSPARRKSSFYQTESPMRRPSSEVEAGLGTPSLGKRRTSAMFRSPDPAAAAPAAANPKATARSVSLGGLRAIPVPTSAGARGEPVPPVPRLPLPRLKGVNGTIAAPPAVPAAQRAVQPQPARSLLQAPIAGKASALATPGIQNKPLRLAQPRLAPPGSIPRPTVKSPTAKEPPQRQQNGLAYNKPVRGPGAKAPPPTATDADEHTGPSSSSLGPLSGISRPSAGEAAKAPKSSAALRESIARAKAARRNTEAKQASGPASALEAALAGFVPEADAGAARPSDGSAVGQTLSRRIEVARARGRLDISAMGLREIPDAVLNMYTPEALGSSGAAWYEAVDLVRFSAADNELEHIGENVFSDSGSADDEGEGGTIFVALEALDLHNNRLCALPAGMALLAKLTSLNLSNNKLESDCWDVISGCAALKDLNLARNKLSGELDARLSSMVHLVALDVSDNSISGVTDSISQLRNLRSLKLSRNKIATLPFHAMASLWLVELSASENQLSDALVAAEVKALPSLQRLDVSNNMLTALSEGPTLRLPALREINLCRNRIEALPDVSAWQELLMLDASENRFSAVPAGFAALKKIRQASFRGNNIRDLDAHIGFMESLEAFQISENPLRSRKLMQASAEEVKRELRLRLDPAADDATAEVPARPAAATIATSTAATAATAVATAVAAPTIAKSTATAATPSAETKAKDTWPVQPGGVVDRSSTRLDAVNAEMLQSLAASAARDSNPIRRLDLQHNLLRCIPPALSAVSATLTELRLSHNRLGGGEGGGGDSYLTARLELPQLVTLDLSCNALASLAPLVRHLAAPCLRTLNVSTNRITALPAPPAALRSAAAFPQLTELLASDNRLDALPPECVAGLAVIDVCNNEIAQLPPRLGLLAGVSRLDVRGNRFRVPGWAVLERGTPATLAWLRDKIPLDERSNDDGKNDDGSSSEDEEGDGSSDEDGDGGSNAGSSDGDSSDGDARAAGNAVGVNSGGSAGGGTSTSDGDSSDSDSSEDGSSEDDSGDGSANAAANGVRSGVGGGASAKAGDSSDGDSSDDGDGDDDDDSSDGDSDNGGANAAANNVRINTGGGAGGGAVSSDSDSSDGGSSDDGDSSDADGSDADTKAAGNAVGGGSSAGGARSGGGGSDDDDDDGSSDGDGSDGGSDEGGGSNNGGDSGDDSDSSDSDSDEEVD